MNKTNNNNIDQSDRILANMVGVSVDLYLSIMSEADEDQANSIITRLLSDHDSEIKEGIQMFNDLI